MAGLVPLHSTQAHARGATCDSVMSTINQVEPEFRRISKLTISRVYCTYQRTRPRVKNKDPHAPLDSFGVSVMDSSSIFLPHRPHNSDFLPTKDVFPSLAVDHAVHTPVIDYINRDYRVIINGMRFHNPQEGAAILHRVTVAVLAYLQVH